MTSAGSALVIALLIFASASFVPPTAHAEHNRTCHPPPPPGGRSQGINNLKQIGLALHDEAAIIDIVADVNPDGRVTARGTAAVSDGTSNTVLVAETRDASATCADTNGSGVAGLVELTIPFRLGRSSERVLATVIPRDGQIDVSGRYPATMRFGEPFGSFEVWLDAVFKEGKGRSPDTPSRDGPHR
jgi:hypothetical protein